jgi:hypothetical protein
LTLLFVTATTLAKWAMHASYPEQLTRMSPTLGPLTTAAGVSSVGEMIVLFIT